MKKFLKSVIALIISFAIFFSFSATAFAYEYGSFDIQSMVKIETDGNKEIRSINSKSINRIKDSKSREYKKLSDNEKLKLIFQELGYNMNSQQIGKVSKSLSLSEIGNIRMEKTYIKVNETGVEKDVSKAEAIQAAKLKNEELAKLTPMQYNEIMTLSDTSPTVSHGNKDWVIDEDNYMAQMIFVIYTPNYNGKGTTPGRYAVMACFEWLTVPFARKTDCMGLFTNQLNWVDRLPGEDSNYFLLASYYKSIYDEKGNIVDSELINDSLDEDNAKISNKDGFCFEYNLKSGFLQIQYSGFAFMIFGVCRVKNYNDPKQSLSISSEYVHIQNPLSASLSFSIGPVGIGVSGIFPNEKRFPNSHEWDYELDFNT